MKNIHILPTDKPSRLSILNSGKLNFGAEIMSSSNSKPQHIYITSDEEIKEGDWFYNTISLKPEPFKACENGDEYVNCSKYSHYRIDCKKIILTTDQDLINDGVQAIDDEFLEWYIKNPSCEWVETFIDTMGCTLENCDANPCINYKIIIPKEPKQENCCTPIGQIKRYIDCKGCDRKPKQKTLEEAVNKFKKTNVYINEIKQEQERSYSEEEVLAFGKFCINKIADFLYGKGDQTDGKEYSMKELFEQFKKK